MNIYLHLDQKERRLIPILKKPQKVVSNSLFKVVNAVFVSQTYSNSLLLFNCTLLAASALPQATPFHESTSLPDHGFLQRHDSSIVLKNPVTGVLSWNENSAGPVNLHPAEKGVYLLFSFMLFQIMESMVFVDVTFCSI